MASRRFFAPQVMAYWLMSASMARQAAALSSAGAGKSGIPCARFTASYFAASIDMPRITLSVNRDALCESRGGCIGIEASTIDPRLCGRPGPALGDHCHPGRNPEEEQYVRRETTQLAAFVATISIRHHRARAHRVGTTADVRTAKTRRCADREGSAWDRTSCLAERLTGRCVALLSRMRRRRFREGSADVARSHGGTPSHEVPGIPPHAGRWARVALLLSKVPGAFLLKHPKAGVAFNHNQPPFLNGTRAIPFPVAKVPRGPGSRPKWRTAERR